MATDKSEPIPAEEETKRRLQDANFPGRSKLDRADYERAVTAYERAVELGIPDPAAAASIAILGRESPVFGKREVDADMLALLTEPQQEADDEPTPGTRDAADAPPSEVPTRDGPVVQPSDPDPLTSERESEDGVALKSAPAPTMTEEEAWKALSRKSDEDVLTAARGWDILTTGMTRQELEGAIVARARAKGIVIAGGGSSEQKWRVLSDRMFNINGHLARLRAGAVVSSITHPLDELRRQGIVLEPIFD